MPTQYTDADPSSRRSAMSPPSPISSSTEQRRVVVRVRGQDVVLPDGRSIIGRSDACRLVLDDPRVSRRHARIEVQGERAEVADLDSANGVLLNGQRVGRGGHPLCDGDVVSVGGHELLIQVRAGADLDPSAGSISSLPPMVTVADDAPTSRRMRPTKVSEATDLIFQVCEQALDAGQVEQAARVAREHLASLADDARRLRDMPADKRTQTMALAFRLAHATGNGEWFDFVVSLLRANQVVCSPEVVEKLRAALGKVDAVDAAKLRSYVAELRGLKPSMETLRAVQDVEQLARAAVGRHRLRLRHDGDTWRAPPPDNSDDGSGRGIA